MLSIDSMMKKPVIHLQTMRVTVHLFHPHWVTLIFVDYFVKLEFIETYFLISRIRSHNFEGVELTVLNIKGQPYCWKMTPAKLLQHYVLIVQLFSKMYWMIAQLPIVLKFLLSFILFIQLVFGCLWNKILRPFLDLLFAFLNPLYWVKPYNLTVPFELWQNSHSN